VNLLWNLVIRILSGERMERSTPSQNAYWLSFLATFPLLIVLPMKGAALLQDLLPDRWLIATMFLAVLLSFGLTLAVAKAFLRFPFGLIPVALATWGVAAAYFWKKIA
jgi:hypothetical protein